MTGSLAYGVEAAAAMALTGNIGASLSVGLQDDQVARDESGIRRNLLLRPAEQLNLALDWQATPGLGIHAQLSHNGRAYDLGDDGTDIHLPSSTSFGLSGVMKVGRTLDRDIHLTAAADNLTDALIIPQSGFPAPGRSFHVGIRID